MTGTQKAELDALHRIQVFVQRHTDALGPVTQSPPRAALDQAVTTLEAQAGEQHAAKVYATSQTVEKELLREDLRLHHMQPIAAIARANLAGTPQITKLKLGQKRLDDVRLVAMADGMAQAAALYTQVFLDHKLPADFIAELRAATAAVQTAVATRNAALQQSKTATQTLSDQTTDARSAVRVLNALVVKQLKGRTELLAAWQMAKQINAKPGAPRGASKKPVPTPTPVLVPDSTATPALVPVLSLAVTTPASPPTPTDPPAERAAVHAA